MTNTQSSNSKQSQVPLLFNSYVNGSNSITNSCHQDAFLIVMSEILNRNPEFMQTLATHPQQTKALQALKSAWKLNCNGRYHESKMALWLWLQNETCNGRITGGPSSQYEELLLFFTFMRTFSET